MKPAFEAIVANRALCTRLCDDICKERFSHAYILEGRAGSGKHTLALQIAAALACENRNDPAAPLPCLHCTSCKKILGGYSTDVTVIGRGDKATLGVEAVRGLKQDIYIPPNDNAAKVYIIEDAHLMTVQAQNALLLSLEEPPSYVVFLLLCEDASALLETIRSRAPILRTEPIEPEEIGAYLLRTSGEARSLEATSPTEFSELLAASDGSIGTALSLLNPKRRRPIILRREAARELVQLCSARKNSAAALRYLSSLGQKRDEVTEQMSVTLLCLRDLLLLKQTEGAPLCFFSDREEAAALAYGFTTPQLLTLCNEVQTLIDRLRMNANVRLTLVAFATGIGIL